MKYMEYQEFEVPAEIQTKLEEMAQNPTGPQGPATLGKAGMFEWMNELSRTEGWSAVWQAFQFPFIVMQREVVTEEV